MNRPLLEIRNLKTDFRTNERIISAVNDISFSVKAGETLGIVGESGSGKSVTALSIMGLLSKNGAVAGEILYSEDGNTAVDLVSLPETKMQEKRGNKIAMIFQEPMTSLNPVVSCGKQVAEALILHKKISKQEAKLQTIELFRKVNLPRPEIIFDSYAHQLSGGQKQRVMIAMAICCNPSLLIADEPTTSLDVTVQATILSLLKQLQKEYNMSMIFISHDLAVISEIADRFIVMYKGKIVETGITKQILNAPIHPYTKALLACRPPLHKKVKRLPVISDFMRENKDGSFTVVQNKPEAEPNVNSNEKHATSERNEDRNELISREPILKVKNLSTWFPVRNGIFGRTTGHVKAVDDVSFEVFPGETLGLVGESGCGKTTLGRTIIRLTEPLSGNVIFKNKDFATIHGKELRQMRKHIQMIFQDPYSSLNPRMMIGKAIMEPMQVHEMYDNDKIRKLKAIELLQRVNMNESHFNRYPHEFSGGQRQRICIARALASEPEFIICDESVSALDVSIQAQVLNLLNDLKRDFNFTSIFISHDLSVVKYMSDTMMVMDQGKIVEMGDPEAIYNSPQSEYTRRLIHAIPGIADPYHL